MNCDLIKLTTFISAFGPTKPNFTFGQQKRLRPPVNSLLTGKWAIDPLRSSESVYQMGHGKLNIYDQDGINLELVDSVELQTKSPDSMVVWGGEVYYVADTRLIKYSVDHDKEVKYLSWERAFNLDPVPIVCGSYLKFKVLKTGLRILRLILLFGRER